MAAEVLNGRNGCFSEKYWSVNYVILFGEGGVSQMIIWGGQISLKQYDKFIDEPLAKICISFTPIFKMIF